MPRPTKSEIIRVSPEFKVYLEDVRDAVAVATGVDISIPDVTNLLLKSKDAPRVVANFKKRRGKGGVKLETEDYLEGLLK